ncbi:hypothetical protein [Paenibacillus dendritiformis]|uniref:Uncharacterized protein n=1 Tax=Paenibacillus dendritiformis C454 TaxID=1131935 RepID=H3SNF4_9BACL|nr:hypothetical protein [Paenibacillus dendritiformis]EHQ59393.1 hypothetical protein PDENDC454_25521 [Paenibacillus dendritiformis C454]CAH8768633.1 hypothetical protein H7S4_001328 [Paenibacillus dendritiformis]
MKNHLHYIPLQKVNPETVKLKDLSELIRVEMDVDKTVSENFPINAFGKDDDDLKVLGAKALLQAFYKIDNVKYDLVYEYGNIEFLGLSEDKDIIFNFKEDNVNASGIYEFTSQFYDLFKMGKYANWLVSRNYEDLLSENLTKLLEKQKDTKKQFRFIREGKNEFLRGFTSTSYKNYDNNLCIYLIFLALHEQSKKHNINFSIDRAYLSDSAFKIYFEQEQPISIDGLGDVYFGAYATNNEIRETQFSFEIRYRIVDPEDPNVYFSAMPQLRDSVFEIRKNYGLEKIKERFSNINRIKEIQESMIEYIEALKSVKEITPDELRRLYGKITDSRDFTSGTKSKMTDLYNKNLVRNTYTILQLLNKINTITVDLDELQYLERIYNDFISELIENQKRK